MANRLPEEKRKRFTSTQTDELFEQKQRPKLKIHCLSDIEKEEVIWLWYPYIPAGKLTLLEGDPGLGKSWISCKMAADISTGRPFPGQTDAMPPQRVLMLSAEDGMGDTVRPRIEALGGDLTKIFISDSFFILDKEGVKELEDTMRQVAATIVFIDPLVAYMGGRMDMNKANEARAMMGPLAEAAKRTGCAVVVVRHLRKGSANSGTNAKYSGIGSIDFTAAVRSGLQVHETKGGQRLLVHFKSNLAREGKPIAFSITDNKFEWGGEWDGEIEHDAPVSTKSLRVAQAEAFIKDFLAYGPKPSSDLVEAAAERGFSYSLLIRAKPHAGAETRKQGGQWEWFLPEKPEQAPSLLPKKIDPEIERLISEAQSRLNKQIESETVRNG